MATRKAKTTTAADTEATAELANDGAGVTLPQPTPIPKTAPDLTADLHRIWDDLKALGSDAEAEFMTVINTKLSGKSTEEVQNLQDAAAKADADQAQREGESDADWEARKAAYDAEGEKNLATRGKDTIVKPGAQ